MSADGCAAQMNSRIKELKSAYEEQKAIARTKDGLISSLRRDVHEQKHQVKHTGRSSVRALRHF